jgi:hypothetical protein
LLIAAIVASVGLFAYQKILQGEISKDETNIASVSDSLQPDTVNQLVSVGNEINFANQLLNSHVLVNKIFDLLQNLTVQKISFTDFTYSDTNGTPSIAMTGESQSYNALTEQYNIFDGSGLIKNQSFSNFSLASDGNISFKFSADVDPSVISYKNAVEPSGNQ